VDFIPGNLLTALVLPDSSEAESRGRVVFILESFLALALTECIQGPSAASTTEVSWVVSPRAVERVPGAFTAAAFTVVEVTDKCKSAHNTMTDGDTTS
jgi:hypothetical protein